jgi:lysophospholipase L1-like esterase
VTRRYLALGDSYTIGEGVTENERWPMQLAAALREAGAPVADPRIIARTGWTTSELLAALDATKPAPPTDFDLVTLLIGVNDQYRRRTMDSFVEAFDLLLRRAVTFAAGEPRRVVAISIPDWGVTPFAASDPRGAAAIAAEIDGFNTAAHHIAVLARARFVDVTRVSRRAARDSALLAADGLHPSGLMYAAWVPLLLHAALDALSA